MKTRNLLVIAFVAFLFAFESDEIAPELAIGEKAPKSDLKLQDVSGKMVSLNEAKKNNGLLVIFSCNVCPFVMATKSRYLEIAEQCKKNEIGVLIMNSNEAKRGDNASMEEMKKYAQGQGYWFNYVLDKDSELANALGATRTPHIFLFNKKMRLVYKGAIDDNTRNIEMVSKHFLADAINNLIDDKNIDPNSTKAIGCSIKRKK